MINGVKVRVKVNILAFANGLLILTEELEDFKDNKNIYVANRKSWFIDKWHKN